MDRGREGGRDVVREKWAVIVESPVTCSKGKRAGKCIDYHCCSTLVPLL